MLDVLAKRRVSSFQAVMQAYQAAGVSIGSCIDGGAGSGSTSRHMLKLCAGDVYAFEPFPGNHKFFEKAPPRIKLMPYALAAAEGEQSFRVNSIVSEDSEWGKKGMAGYSSVGHLVSVPHETDLRVQCVRADNKIAAPVDFVKLDLQGGELAALQGMPRIVSECLFMWVEYSGQPGLLPFLQEGFDVYDTEYFFLGDPAPKALDIFEPSKTDISLSTGKKAWFGFRRTPWSDDYESELIRLRREIGLVQTDLVCVNRKRPSEFVAALNYL